MKQILLLVFLFLYNVESYNIETSDYGIRVIIQSTQDIASETSEPAPSFSGNGESVPSEPIPSEFVPSEERSINANGSFFGYDISISNVASQLSLTIGAPKTRVGTFLYDRRSTSVKESGSVFSCLLQDIYLSNFSTQCSSNEPRNLNSGDAFGLSLARSNDGIETVCSPTKIQNCTQSFFAPGYCFRRITQTERWNPTHFTLNSECPSSTTLDLVFALDGSGSVGKLNFAIVKEWVKQVAASFDTEDDSTRIGVIQYSHYYDYVSLKRVSVQELIQKYEQRGSIERALHQQPFIVTEIGLGQYKKRSRFEAAVDNITLSGYTTFTAQALNKSVDDFKTSDRFPSTAKVLILLTDGKSSDSHLLNSSANYVRSLGINTIAVGVGDAQVPELRLIATGTQSDENVFYVSQFEQLGELVKQLKANILTFVLEGSGGSGFLLQYAQTGFSIQPSRKMNRRNKSNVPSSNHCTNAYNN